MFRFTIVFVMSVFFSSAAFAEGHGWGHHGGFGGGGYGYRAAPYIGMGNVYVPPYGAGYYPGMQPGYYPPVVSNYYGYGAGMPWMGHHHHHRGGW
jgi:hypothetical protein